MKPISDEEPYVPTAEEMQRVAANLRGVVDIADVEVTDAEPVRRGGPGSGHFGHEGRPGQVGGSAPSAEAGPEAATQVGITSYREGRNKREVFAEGREFEARLRQISSVEDVRLLPGLGIYQGAQEPTWIVSYKGNGKAAQLIAETAEAADQDGVLMFFPPTADNSQPVSEVVFEEVISPADRAEIIGAMGEAGIEGGTWGKDSQGNAYLRVAAVPQWGFDAAFHGTAMTTLMEGLAAAGYTATRRDSEAAVLVMEKEGQNSYDAWKTGKVSPP